MTRPLPSASARPRLALLLTAVLVVAVAGCASAQGTSAPSAPSASAGVPGSVAPSQDAPSAGFASPDPASPSVAPSEPPTVAPTVPAEASPSSELEAAGDCTGTEENRTFYGSVATAVDWTVYCPVLPSRWFVEAGQYRLAAGGRLAIAYRGPNDTRFSLDEGVWCTDGSGCTPHGTEVGQTAFGDRRGTLIATTDGNYSIIVDAGSTVSWLLTGDGLDEATVRAFGAALIVVGD